MEELRDLPQRTTRELRERCQTLTGTMPPGGLSRDLLMRVIADQLQEAALGGLPPAAKRKLAALTRNAEKRCDGTGRLPHAPTKTRVQAYARVARKDAHRPRAGRRL